MSTAAGRASSPLRVVPDEPTPQDELLLQAWTRHQQAAGLRPRTIDERAALVRRCSARAGRRVVDLSADDLVRFLAQSMAPGTRQTYYCALRAWHKWLQLYGHRQDDPTVMLPTPRVPRGEQRPITTEHLRVLLASRMNRRTRMLIMLCAYQGLRVSEACQVRGEDVDLVGDRLFVIGKGGVAATVPLSPVIRAQARRWPRKGFWFPGYDPTIGMRPRSASSIISTAMRRAGVPGTAHSLRHWHATELLKQGVDVRTVQTILRHASLATTERYLHVDDERQRDGIARLPDVTRPKGGVR